MKNKFLVAMGCLLLSQVTFAQVVSSQTVQEKARYLLRSLTDRAYRLNASELQIISSALDRAQDVVDGNSNQRPPPYEPPRPGEGGYQGPYKSIKLTQVILGNRGTRDLAQTTYDQTCTNFKRSFYDLPREVKLQAISCGNPTDIGGSNAYQFKSSGTVELDVPVQTTEFKSSILSSYGSAELATNSFRSECENLKAQAKKDAGSRFVAVTCGEPQDIGGANAYQYKASASAYIVAYNQARSAQETLTGNFGGKDTARSSWDTKCQDYREELRARYRGRLLFVDCGEPRDIGGSSSYRYTSTATVHFEP